MQFHHHGYVSGDPRVQPAAGVGLDRPDELPDEVDVLIVGTGPAGMIAAAQLSQFPEVTTRIVERRAGRLAIGQADGIQARSVETFQAFGFAGRIAEEAYRITEMCFWHPDPADPSRIVRGERPRRRPRRHQRVPAPHRQPGPRARLLRRVHGELPDPDGARLRLRVPRASSRGRDDHVDVTPRAHAGERAGQEKVVRAKYVAGRRRCAQQGARPRSAAPWRATRRSTPGASWTSSPSPTSRTSASSARSSPVRAAASCSSRARAATCSACTSTSGEIDPDAHHEVRSTTIEQIIAKANAILHPYTLDVRDVAWHSVYEVGHRLTDRFDDVPLEESGTRDAPRVHRRATPATPTAPRPARA